MARAQIKRPVSDCFTMIVEYAPFVEFGTDRMVAEIDALYHSCLS